MKPSLDFDTSLFGGVFDEDFEEISTLLFENVRTHFNELPKENLEFVKVTEEAFILAEKYLEEKVVDKTSAHDCRHIATATNNKVDYLVSWNFKHKVNVFRIRSYNSVNSTSGNIQLNICLPKEIVNNEDVD